MKSPIRGRCNGIRATRSETVVTTSLSALTRAVSPTLADCQLTHVVRESIDIDRANEQHAAYRAALVRAGCAVLELPALPDHPDAVFVEDVAIVLDEIAVMTRPGAQSRRGEVESVATALAPYRTLQRIEAPGTIDGGDVLRLGRRLYVGLSGRSNADGIEQLRRLLQPFGYTVAGVPLRDCLHLKSAVTQVATNTLLLQPAWVDAALFPDARIIEVDPDEEHAANALAIGTHAIYPECFPRTRARLEAAGIAILAVDVSELQKAEGAVTCCSLIFRADAAARHA